MHRAVLVIVIAVAVACGATASAQPVISSRGSVATMLDAVPHVDATELRLRLDSVVDVEFDDRWVVKAGGWIDALGASRRGRSEADLVYQPGEIYVRHRRESFDLTAGFQRVVWGTLDEIQPTDVVNPIDVSRFLVDGRSEARLPVLALRGRAFFPGDTTVDAVYVPFFRRGRYDLLDERSSPFNLAADQCRDEACVAAAPGSPGVPVVLPLLSDPPARTLAHGSGGVRVSRPFGGVDVGASVYRGWQAFPLVSIGRAASGPSAAGIPPMLPTVALRESWSRLTMIGGDAEAARGSVTWRAEGALLVDTGLQSEPGALVIDGRSLQVGAGLDWTVGPWRLFGNAIARRAWAVGPSASLAPSTGGLQLVGGAERKFARDTRLLRGFAVFDPGEGTAFVRGLGAWNVRDNLWLEGSAAWFAGDGTDFLGRFTDRDFVSVRVKYYF